MGKDTDPVVSAEDKTVFDWVKESNAAQVKVSLKDQHFDLNSKDDSGLGLIHWASDRGSNEVVQLLIEAGADVKAQVAAQREVPQLDAGARRLYPKFASCLPADRERCKTCKSMRMPQLSENCRTISI